MEKMELIKSLKDNFKQCGIVYTSKKEKAFIEETMQEKLLIRANGKKEAITFENDFFVVSSSFNPMKIRYENIAFLRYSFSQKYNQLSIEVFFSYGNMILIFNK